MMGETVNGFSCRRRRKHEDDFSKMFNEPVFKSARLSGHQERNGDLFHSFDSACQFETRSPVCRDIEMNTTSGESNQKLPMNSFPLCGLNSRLEVKNNVVADGHASHFSASASASAIQTDGGSELGQAGFNTNNGHVSNGPVQTGCLAPSSDCPTMCQFCPSDQVKVLPVAQQVSQQNACLQCAAGESGHFHHIQKR